MATPDLAVELCGLRLRNPLVLASGPLSFSAAAIQAAFAAGAAAVVTKTIRPQATVNPVPHIAEIGGGGLLNTEGWSDFPARRWIEAELPALRDRAGVLVASLGHTPAEVAQLAGPVARSGRVDLLELVSYRAEDAAPMVRAAKAETALPVLVKVSANWPDLPAVVDACLQAGADGLTAIDSLGPALRIDIESGRPVLGRPAWLSGAPIRPIAQRVVAEIALRHDLPIVGTGGVGRGREAIEMMMAGATAVGVHTAPLLRGLGFFGKALREIEAFLAERGYDRIAQVRGLALPYVGQVSNLPSAGQVENLSNKTAVLQFAFAAERCTHCDRCVRVCAYRARTLRGDEMEVDMALCRSCGLCVTVCRPGALTARPVGRV